MRSRSLMSAFHLDQENAIAELTSAIWRYNRYSAAAFYHMPCNTDESPLMESRETCLVSRLSWDMFFHGSVLAQSRHLYVLPWLCLLSFHVSSCLMSHDCVMTVSLSGIANVLIPCWNTDISCWKKAARTINPLFTYLRKNGCSGGCCFMAITCLDCWQLYLGKVSVSDILTAY